MSVPVGIPLVGGANVWAVLGPLTALSISVGWLMGEVDRRLAPKPTAGEVTRLPDPEVARGTAA